MAVRREKNEEIASRLNIALEQLAGHSLKAGWFASSKYAESGMPVAAVAAMQELGTGKIPPRPFMRPTAVKQRNAWASIAAREAKMVLNGQKTAVDALNELGGVAVGDVQSTISKIQEPPLSPITIELRRLKKMGRKIPGKTVGEAAANVAAGKNKTAGVSIKPLIDSGYLFATITHVVEGA